MLSSMLQIRGVLCCLATLSATVTGDAGNIWGYQDGIPPELWPLEYRTCGGNLQSPVNIDVSQVRLDTSIPTFDLTALSMLRNVRMKFENSGHTVEVDVEAMGNNVAISGGGLPHPYKIKQFHLHWGSPDRRGSEHSINGRMFPMEMHIVTYSSRFKMYEQAKNSTGGLAVLSFLFDVGNDNPAFDDIIGNLNQIGHKDDYIDIQALSLKSLIPESTDVFYGYYGSLTTPPCYESVIWTIFHQHVKISDRQINQFRHLAERHFYRFRDISDNFRPVQPLNSRFVYTNDVRGLQYSRPSQSLRTLYALSVGEGTIVPNQQLVLPNTPMSQLRQPMSIPLRIRRQRVPYPISGIGNQWYQQSDMSTRNQAEHQESR